MTCLRCKQDPGPFAGPGWRMDARRCAFDESGAFTSDNWSCATMYALRDAAETARLGGAVLWAEADQSLRVVPLPDSPRFVVLSVYKHRGRTEGAWLVDQTTMRPLTLEMAEAALSEVEKS